MTDFAHEGQTGHIYVTPSGIPIRNLWHMLLYAWNQARTQAPFKAQVEDAPSLDALFAQVLADMLEQRLRVGLGRSYVPVERTLQGIRGRVDFAESLKKLTFQNGMAHCRYQEFSPNVPKNQIVVSTLANLARVGQFGKETSRAEALRYRLRRLVRDLHDIEPIEVSPGLIRRQVLGRNENDYRLMLAICELVARRQMPTNQEGFEHLPGLDRDAMTLYQVYERFVANFYRLHLPDWNVAPQKTLDWHADASSPYLPSMQADLVLTHRASDKIVVLDTKFTAKSLTENPYGKLTFDSSHLYQLYAYLRSQEHLSAAHRAALGVLLYPTVKLDLNEVVSLQGHALHLVSVDLTRPWVEIEAQLLAIPAQIVATYDNQS